MDRYEARINLHGNSKRERDLNILKDEISKKSITSLSYKTVLINNIERNLIIDSGTSKNIKNIESIPDETFLMGEYIVWNNYSWLITDVDTDNEVYTKGKMQLCNYTIKFQSPTGTILSYPCIDDESTVTIDETKVINTSGTKHTIKLPFDAYTKMIAEDKRFIMDVEGKAKPNTWIVEGNNNTEFNYGDNGGIVVLHVKKDQFNATTDNAELMIANYQSSVTPTPTNTYANISVNGSLYTNSTRTFTATFYNADNTVNSGITAIWSIVYPSGYSTSFSISNVDSRSINLTIADNDELIGQNVVVNVSDGNGEYVGSLEVMIH